jgi:hypothetical protein
MTSRAAPRPSLAKEWRAWVPIAIPLFFVALLVRRIVTHGLVVEADEGVEAHLFQLLMPVQLVVMAYFGATWIPRDRRAAFVLMLQVVLTAGLFGLVYWAEHAAR